MNDTNGNWMGTEFEVYWSNSGTTVAKAATFQDTAKPFFEDLPKTYDFPLESEKTEGVVSPKGVYGTSLLIPRSQLEDAWRSKSRMFVWGTVVYKDAFEGDPLRVSEFCIEIFHLTVSYITPPIPVANQPTPAPSIGAPNTTIATFQLRSCSRGAHTCYDEDCKDYADRIKDMGN
jgi:hypothetical protein